MQIKRSSVVLPDVGSNVLLAEPTMAEIDGEHTPIFARALCEVIGHNASGTVTLMVVEGDTMNYVSAAGALIASVPPEKLVIRPKVVSI